MSNTEATPVVLVYLSQNDYLRNTVTMLKEENGQPVIHKQIDGSKIIDGDDFIVQEGIVS